MRLSFPLPVYKELGGMRMRFLLPVYLDLVGTARKTVAVECTALREVTAAGFPAVVKPIKTFAAHGIGQGVTAVRLVVAAGVAGTLDVESRVLCLAAFACSIRYTASLSLTGSARTSTAVTRRSSAAGG